MADDPTLRERQIVLMALWHKLATAKLHASTDPTPTPTPHPCPPPPRHRRALEGDGARNGDQPSCSSSRGDPYAPAYGPG